jgi:CHAD domain-containing protein
VQRRQLDLAVGPGFRLSQLRLPRGAATASERFECTHWDSPDLRLAAWEAGLRHRPGRGWRVTLLAEAEGQGALRVHLDLPGGPEAPPAEAARLLSGYLLGAPLVPVAQLRHREWRVCLGEVGLVHQVVTRTAERRPLSRVRRVSVRYLGDPSAARRPLAALRRAGVVEPATLPLLTELLGPAAAPRWRWLRLDASADVATAIHALLGDCTTRLVRHHALLLEGSDPEGVHHTRVACRRLRSALRTFSPLLEATWAEALRDDLRAFAAELGRVRDSEVLLARLRASAHEQGLDAGLIDGLLAALVAEREEARAAVLRQAGSEEHRGRIGRLLEAAQRPAVRDGVAGRPAAVEMLPALAASRRRLRRRVRRLSDFPTDAELHRTRILAKRCRYAVLALVPVLGAEAERTATLLGELQDALGEQHDAVLAAEWLRGRGGTALGFAAGQLFAVERARADRGRRSWRRAWRAVDRRSTWRWTRLR